MSKAVSKFNGLNGAIVPREELLALKKLAKKEQQYHLAKWICDTLKSKKDKELHIEILEPVKPLNIGLSGAEMEMLDIDDINEDFEETGLNGIPQAEIYDLITNKIIADFENDYKWESGINDSFDNAFMTAYNFKTKKAYRGINQLLLGDLFGMNPLENPYYLTFKQVKELGGTVRAKAKSKDAIFYTILYKYKDFKTTDRSKFIVYLKSIGFDDKEIPSVLFANGYGILRIYNVFNGKDIDGIDFGLSKLTNTEEKEKDTIEICEKIVSKYPAPAPKIKFGGKQPYYLESGDYVQMPFKASFDDIRSFYAVLFHELIHSTGSANRLKREKGRKFGDKKYSFEELVAEIGACFMSATCGFYYYTNKNANAYIKGWRRGIVAELKKDNKGIFKAAALSQKACDFMLKNMTEKDFIIEKQPVIEVKKTKAVAPVAKPKTRKRNSNQLELGLKGSKSKSTVLAENKNTTEVKPKVAKKEVSQAKPKTTVQDLNKNSLAYKMANRPKNVEYFEIQDKEIARLLGKIEKKNKDSVFISLTGSEGSMKTRMAFQIINAFAQKYKTGHASCEEHPDSTLYYDKAGEYLNAQALKNIENPEIKSLHDLHKLILDNEVIVIDSYTKMKEIEKSFEVDKDCRKKYDGKLFIVIFQQTVDGKMRGGSKSQYDADIVLFTEKFDNYHKNYVYATKHRYSKEIGLQYNIFSKSIQNNKAVTPANKEIKLKFKVK